MVGSPVVIERLTPARTLLGMSAVVLMALVLAPVEPRWSGEPLGYVYLAFGYGAMLLGFGFWTLLGWSPVAVSYDAGRLKRLIGILLALGLAGFLAKALDMTVFRPVSFDTIKDARETGTADSSLASVVAAGLLPCLFGAVLTQLHAWRSGRLQRISTLALVIAVVPSLVGILFGSRSLLLVTGLQLGIAALLLLPRLGPRILATGVAIAVAAPYLFAVVFLKRAEDFGYDPAIMVRYSVFAQTVPASPAYLDMIDGLGPAKLLFLGLTSILQYLVHGLFEFLWLVEMKDDGFAWGARMFFFVPKFVAMVKGDSTLVVSSLIAMSDPRPGVYKTLFGTLYIDFGPFLPIAGFVIGAFVGRVRIAVISGNPLAFPLYVLLLAQVALVPIVDGISLGASIFANLAFTIVWLGGSLACGIRPAIAPSARNHAFGGDGGLPAE